VGSELFDDHPDRLAVFAQNDGHEICRIGDAQYLPDAGIEYDFAALPAQMLCVLKLCGILRVSFQSLIELPEHDSIDPVNICRLLCGVAAELGGLLQQPVQRLKVIDALRDGGTV
jgi:hypothetical protein